MSILYNDVRDWVASLSQYPQSMLQTLYNVDPDSWQEISLPQTYDRVYVNRLPDDYEGDCHEGEIFSANYENNTYTITLDDNTDVNVDYFDFNVERDDFFPMHGTLWSFSGGYGDYWIKHTGGLAALCECGFRVYEHDKWGFFFGIDGSGYDFYSHHWLPLFTKYKKSLKLSENS